MDHVKDFVVEVVFQKNQKQFIRANKSLLKTQKRFKSEMPNEEVNKIVLNWNDDKRIQSIHSIETYTYGTTKNLVSEKEINIAI